MKYKLLVLIVAIACLLTQTSNSQFGKNIVQYDKFNWKYIESNNFEVYYNQGSKPLAEFAALSAEKALESIQRTLNFRINKKIRLIVYNTHNEFQQTNVIDQFMYEGIGGVTELSKNRVVVPFQGNYSQFDHVIHHELVHAVMNDMFYGGTFQTALRSGNLGKIPIWISEGLAEFESLGGYNIETDMFMRDISLNEKLRDLTNMNGYYAYRGGQAFLWYIAEKYGEERVGDLINRLRVQRDLEAVFKSAFNMSLEELSKDFKDELKKFYWPDIAKYEAPKDFAERITNQEKEENYYNSSPAISPNGKMMAYISAPNGIYSIMIKSLEDKKKSPEKLVSSFRQQDFEDLNILTPGISWNPEGTKLAISAKSGGEDAIFIVDIKTGKYDKILLGLKSITSVNWSHDGSRLAFIGSDKGQSDIYIYHLTKKTLQNITDDFFSDANPVWSHDNKNIYFISDRGNASKTNGKLSGNEIWQHEFDATDIFKIDISSSAIQRITFSANDNKTSFALSSDDKFIIYSSDENGILNLYKLSLTDKEAKPLPITNSLTGISQISLSNDDSKLLFSTLIEGSYDIFLMRYPFDRKLNMDTLPLTKFKERQIQRKTLVSKIENDTISNTTDTTEALSKKVYGNFELEFSRQQVVKANPDATTINNVDLNISSGSMSYTFNERDYKISFSPDIISGNPAFSTLWGFQGITQMMFSDVMGDHKILLQMNLFIDLRNSTFYAAYLYQPGVIDYMLSAYHGAVFSYGRYQDTLVSLYRLRDYGSELMASYPFDLFNRIEWGLSWKNVSKENVWDVKEPYYSRMLFIPQGRYVHDDVLYGYFAPLKGSRYYFGFMGTPKISSNGIGFITINGDYRQYIQISDMSSIVIRGAAGASMGPNPRTFYLGGTDYWINSWVINYNDIFKNPEDYAFVGSSFIMPLRGFGVGAVSGQRYFLSNVEFRFPFIGWLFATPIPIAQAFMGAVFFDVGGAWSGDWNSFKATTKDYKGRTIPNDLLMSAGVGLRTYLLGIPLKIDVAWGNLNYMWSEPRWLFSLGYDF
jgi:Tol biopolymer transport system component